MAGGARDSSLTRVQPVFTQLYRYDPTGSCWLGRLLALGSRAKEVGLPTEPEWWGRLTDKPRFELPVLSPRDYLVKLASSPDRLVWPLKGGQPKVFRSAITTEKRKLLRAGDGPTQEEAKQKLAKRTAPGGESWWVLEGRTTVDCGLFASGVTLFIEGKRTETSLTDKIEWDSRRNQICRNLDCLRVLGNKADRHYVLLVVEEGSPLVGDAEKLDRAFSVAWDSWPHLSENAARELWRHFLGYTTWQRIVTEFRSVGPNLILPETVTEARNAGLIE
jgi:hypothetical protein